MRPADSRYRPDIDGLRAVAVLGVIAYHVAPNRVTGGFVGVDVFFVISGFLISQILARAADLGSLNLTAFYSRRVRRIFPPLIGAMLLTLALAWWINLPDEFVQLGRHVIAGSLFASNVLLWSEAGYFDRLAEQKPLLHLWSLGVEEQFYLLWPIVLVLILRLKRARTGAIIALAAASFAVNIITVRTAPSAAFYLPFSRFWEMLLGALLAVRSTSQLQGDSSLAPWQHWLQRPGLVRDGTSVAGLILIGSSMALYQGSVQFPGWLALIPTLGAAAIIAVGPGAVVNRVFLGHRVPVYIGLISYSLYLLHWPLISFIHVLAIDGGAELRLLKIAAIATAFVGAILSHHFVEAPVLRSAAAGFPWRILMLMGAVTLVGVAVVRTDGFATIRGPWSPGTEVIQSRGFFSDVRSESSSPECVNTLSSVFRPAFRPRTDFCLNEGTVTGSHDFILLGDSHAQRLYAGLREEGGSSLMLGRGTCLPLLRLGVRWPNEGDNLNCPELSEELTRFVTGAPPRVLLLHAFFVREEDGRLIRTGEADLASALLATLERVVPAIPRIIFVLDVPELPFSAGTCSRRPIRAGRERCAFPRATYEASKERYLAGIQEVLAAFPSVIVFEPAEALCDSIVCYGARNGQLLYSDEHHLNATGARLVASRLRRHMD